MNNNKYKIHKHIFIGIINNVFIASHFIWKRQYIVELLIAMIMQDKTI